MHSTVRTAVWPPGEAYFANRTESGDERRDMVSRPFSMGYQVEHRVLGWPISCGRILRVRYYVAPGAAERRLVVAYRALICVEPSSQPGRVGHSDEVGVCRIDM